MRGRYGKTLCMGSDHFESVLRDYNRNRGLTKLFPGRGRHGTRSFCLEQATRLQTKRLITTTALHFTHWSKIESHQLANERDLSFHAQFSLLRLLVWENYTPSVEFPTKMSLTANSKTNDSPSTAFHLRWIPRISHPITLLLTCIHRTMTNGDN